MDAAQLDADLATMDCGPATAAKTTPRARPKLRTLADLDRRTTAARRAFELRDSLIDDLGGEPAVSAMKRAVVEAAATMGAMIEDMAARYLEGQPTDLALYATLANAQRRLLADLGLERRAKDITSETDLQRYLRERSA